MVGQQEIHPEVRARSVANVSQKEVQKSSACDVRRETSPGRVGTRTI